MVPRNFEACFDYQRFSAGDVTKNTTGRYDQKKKQLDTLIYKAMRTASSN